MKIIKKISIMQSIVDNAHQKKQSIGFVPTMGALHEGHISLVKKAKKQNDIVVLSIFVNPMQFGPKEDYKKYPRTLKKDLELLNKYNIDYVFLPSVKEMYPTSENFTTININRKTNILCAKFRKGHFTGVATIVAKLFNIVKPDKAYFGEKDYQQLKIIEILNSDLNFNIKIIPCKTIRHKDGLAYSSRNNYLSPRAREKATYIYKSLTYCKNLLLKKNYSFNKCKALTINFLKQKLRDIKYKIQYLEILDQDLNPVKNLPKKGQKLRIFIAVFIERTRLIDNLPVNI